MSTKTLWRAAKDDYIDILMRTVTLYRATDRVDSYGSGGYPDGAVTWTYLGERVALRPK